MSQSPEEVVAIHDEVMAFHLRKLRLAEADEDWLKAVSIITSLANFEIMAGIHLTDALEAEVQLIPDDECVLEVNTAYLRLAGDDQRLVWLHDVMRKALAVSRTALVTAYRILYAGGEIEMTLTRRK